MDIKIHQLVFLILVVFLLKITVGDNMRQKDKNGRKILNRSVAAEEVIRRR